MTRCLTCTLLSLLLAGCGSYDFTVNDRVVYTPRPLFKDYTIPDPALKQCVDRAVADNNVTHASQLTTLNCSESGIERVAGLGVFTGLELLVLSGNKIRDVTALGSLTVLVELHLQDNDVIDPVPLYQLPALNVLDLSGNPDLRCPASGAFLRVPIVTLPDHCL